MRKQIQKIIDDAEALVANHPDISLHGLCEELIYLEARVLKISEKLAEIDIDTDEEKELTELLDKAIQSINKADDAVESHHGGGYTF